MTHLDGLILLKQAAILKLHAEIVSGAYKQRRIYSFSPLSDAAKLQAVLELMSTRVRELSDLVEKLEAPK